MSGSNFDKTTAGEGPEHTLIDHVLGEGSALERAALRDRLASDLDLAVESGELRGLFGDMRKLHTEPTGQLGLAVRYAVLRCAERRAEAVPSWGHLAWRLVQVATVAAAGLLAFVSVDQVARQSSARSNLLVVAGSDEDRPQMVHASKLGDGRAGPTIDVELAQLLSTSRVPVQDPVFLAALKSYESLPLPGSFLGWIDAAEELAMMRIQFRLRYSQAERRSALRSAGAPDLDHRLGVLAKAIAEGLEDELVRSVAKRDESRGGLRTRGARSASTCELAIGLRALLAAGSSRSIGSYRGTVRSVSLELEHRLEQSPDDGTLASILAALGDLAVMEGGRFVDIVGLRAEQLARRTLMTVESGRPRLLHWQTPVAQLADAGRVLRLAPGFGVHAAVAFRARMMIAAHLQERMQGRSHREVPVLVAALLYGFGDIIDRDSAERALRLWRPELLVPNFVALHHIAWSKTPTRIGWAEFQQELRGLSGVPTPASTRDAAALFLCLSMNFSGPGAGVLLGESMG